MRHNLRAAIVAKFGSQVECARETGIHPVRVNRLCNGWADPTPVERERISAALNADPTWLFSSIFKIQSAPAGQSLAKA
jgi:transcriptional regulator with XRE-family HTH domain